MAKDLFNITFKGVEEALEVAQKKAQLLDANIRNALARTVLWGAGEIAKSCPVDTGRLRSSILGYLVDKNPSLAGLLNGGNAEAIASGKAESVTDIIGYEGRIGTNVKYAADVEYGHIVTGPKKLTPKQRRYLFAVGILKAVNGRVIVTDVHQKINRRSGITNRIKGKGFFRKNLVLIDRYFHDQMKEAIEATEEDRLIPVTF